MVFTISHRGRQLLGGEPRCWPLKKSATGPSKDFPQCRPSAQTCLRTDVFQEQLKKKVRVENSLSFTRVFCPRCVLNFVRIINCVSKHEDKLALWPLMRWHNSSERFIALRSQFPGPYYSSHSFNAIKNRKGRERWGWELAWNAALKGPQPSC